MPLETTIPTKIVGPIKIITDIEEEVQVPLATFETPLWNSVARGARVTCATDGIFLTLLKDNMTRSIILQAPNAKYAHELVLSLDKKQAELKKVVNKTSKFAQLIEINNKIIGNLLYLRFVFKTGDAAGHNMTTKATEAILQWLLVNYKNLTYISLSGNFCTDKKASAVNSILGRGKSVVAEIKIPEAILEKVLRTTAQKIVDINIKKNLLGSIVAGSICSANAHFVNMLLAFCLATGQDAANIVEGSQGIVHAEVINENDLYFSCTLPNLILGTIGNGKDLVFVEENLKKLGCLEKRAVGLNAQRLAMIAASVVLCGELSLLAALTISNELMRAHLTLERRKNKKK